MEKKYSDEAIFCVKYLQDKGYLAGEKLDELTALLDDFNVDFKMVKVRKDFFNEAAEKLYELWPSGNKDGKYPWRDSVNNIRIRLKALWNTRGLGEYTIDDVLLVARKYLARFENDAKYMKTLKYFIYKHKASVPDANGEMRYVCESELADMLESLTSEQRQQAELESIFGTEQFEQGNLI